MLSIVVTFEVSQPERSREESDGQPGNMCPMSVTADVSQPETLREESQKQS